MATIYVIVGDDTDKQHAFTRMADACGYLSQRARANNWEVYDDNMYFGADGNAEGWVYIQDYTLYDETCGYDMASPTNIVKD